MKWYWFNLNNGVSPIVVGHYLTKLTAAGVKTENIKIMWSTIYYYFTEELPL